MAEQVVAIVERSAEPGARVLAITLELGDLAGVEEDALLFALTSAMLHTRAEGATVHVLRLPARARCHDCGGEQAIEIRYQPCGICGRGGLEILQGTEMRVRSIVVEERKAIAETR
nr:hydrogenase maturation nickel metallochaperone HypA [Niveibacterium umoris]